jgi:hypothetical protein
MSNIEQITVTHQLVRPLGGGCRDLLRLVLRPLEHCGTHTLGVELHHHQLSSHEAEVLLTQLSMSKKRTGFSFSSVVDPSAGESCWTCER